MLPKIDNPERLTKLFEHPAFENGDNTKNKNKTKNNVDNPQTETQIIARAWEGGGGVTKVHKSTVDHISQ